MNFGIYKMVFFGNRSRTPFSCMAGEMGMPGEKLPLI